MWARSKVGITIEARGSAARGADGLGHGAVARGAFGIGRVGQEPIDPGGVETARRVGEDAQGDGIRDGGRRFRRGKRPGDLGLGQQVPFRVEKRAASWRASASVSAGRASAPPRVKRDHRLRRLGGGEIEPAGAAGQREREAPARPVGGIGAAPVGGDLAEGSAVRGHDRPHRLVGRERVVEVKPSIRALPERFNSSRIGGGRRRNSKGRARKPQAAISVASSPKPGTRAQGVAAEPLSEARRLHVRPRRVVPLAPLHRQVSADRGPRV